MGTRSFITVDLGFGDAGKGTVVDTLVRKFNAGLVIRYNGGGQAAHNVYNDQGLHHTFGQFGSGTLVPGVKTLLSRYVVVNPLTLMLEGDALTAKGLVNVYSRMHIDERAIVTTPFHRAVNRLCEYARGGERHGSCGMGFGATVDDELVRGNFVLRIGDLLNKDTCRKKIDATRNAMWNVVKNLEPAVGTREEDWTKEMGTFSEETVCAQKLTQIYNDFAHKIHVHDDESMSNLINGTPVTVFEGAQGVLLDQDYGFHPYTTWSHTTSRNADLLLEEAECGHPVTKVGITRIYAVRHGPGPFPSEDAALGKLLPDLHNVTNAWQREFRVGWLDLPLLRYALMVNGGVDCLAVTHADRLILSEKWKVWCSYDQSLQKPTSIADQVLLTNLLFFAKCDQIAEVENERMLRFIEIALSLPIGITSHGPRPCDKETAGLEAICA